MINSSTTRFFRSNKKMAFVIIALLFSYSSLACEICGCSINGYHYGILPQFKKNLIGVKYGYRSYQSQHLISETLHILGNRSTEYYNSAEIWGRYYVNKRLQLFAFVPFNHFRQHESGVSTTAKGIGDITLAASYMVYNTAARKDKTFKQTLLAGGGVKVPTGKFDKSKSGQELNPSINTGSGSVDYLANLIYNCRYKRAGLNLDANYRVNSANGKDFRFGNRFTSAARFFYWQDVGKKITLLPNSGIMYEHAEKDRHQQELQKFSGGNIQFFTAGLEVYSGILNVGVTYNHPLSQNLSEGLVTMNNQFSAHLNILF